MSALWWLSYVAIGAWVMTVYCRVWRTAAGRRPAGWAVMKGILLSAAWPLTIAKAIMHRLRRRAGGRHDL